jgi:hypothetical protein
MTSGEEKMRERERDAKGWEGSSRLFGYKKVDETK